VLRGEWGGSNHWKISAKMRAASHFPFLLHLRFLSFDLILTARFRHDNNRYIEPSYYYSKTMGLASKGVTAQRDAQARKPQNGQAHQQAVIAQAAPSTFRLLNLPAEFRLKIYESAVTLDSTVRITFGGGWDVRVQAAREWQSQGAVALRTQPALAKVNKDIRVDTLKLYYRCNEFESGYCSAEQDREGPVLVAGCVQSVYVTVA